jgi:hypothetical protein
VIEHRKAAEKRYLAVDRDGPAASNQNPQKIEKAQFARTAASFPAGLVPFVTLTGGLHFVACSAHRAGPLIGEVLGVKPAPIEYRFESKRRRLRLGDFADSEIEGLPGQDGADVTIADHPFNVVPAFCAVVAKSKQMKFSDLRPKVGGVEQERILFAVRYRLLRGIRR